MKIDTTFAHVTWHNTHSETPFLSCTSVSVFWSLLPPHLSLFSRNVLPPGLVVEHNVVKMGMGGVLFLLIVYLFGGSRGAQTWTPLPLPPFLWEVMASGVFPQNPLQSRSAFCIRVTFITPQSPRPLPPRSIPPTLCSRQDQPHYALKVEFHWLPC